MPETPDFEQIAQTLIHDAAMIVGALSAGTDCTPARRSVDELLRQVWNARGAADRATVEHDLSTQMGATAAGPYVKNLDRALRGLDR